MSLLQDSNQPCEDDSDCGSEYYCYKTSKKCVNFTDCLQYNRVEGVTQARSATQCGACRAGYECKLLFFFLIVNFLFMFLVMCYLRSDRL